jgi:hypothetical protein
MKGKLTAVRGADRMILVAGAVFVIDSFLPWIGIGRLTASGWSSGGVAVLSILLAILATALAVARTLGARVDLGEIKDGFVYLVCGLGALFFALLRWATIPRFFGAKYGLFVAIVAGGFLAYGGWMKLQAKA